MQHGGEQATPPGSIVPERQPALEEQLNVPTSPPESLVVGNPASFGDDAAKKHANGQQQELGNNNGTSVIVVQSKHEIKSSLPPFDTEAGAAAGPRASSSSAPESPRAAVANLPGGPGRYFMPYWDLHNIPVVLFAILTIWAFCWMYLGVTWNPLTRLQNLRIGVLNCDLLPAAAELNASFAPLLPQLAPRPLATQLLGASILNPNSSASSLFGWDIKACEGGSVASPCGPREAECVQGLMDDVLEGEDWALLYFPSNYTRSYLSWYGGAGIAPARQTPTSYFVYARGRDYSTYTYILQGAVQKLLPSLSRTFFTSLAEQSSTLDLLSSKALLVTGLAIQEVDMAPVRLFGQHFASYVFCILLWLGSAFMVNVSWQYKLPVEVAALDPRVSPADRPSLPAVLRAMAIKTIMAVLFMFIMMVFLMIVVWALGKGDEQWNYNAGYGIAFGWYMSWSFLSVNAVLLHVLGVERFSSFSALFLILNFTSGSAILSQDICNRFFYIGKGLPFYYGVRGFRTIFFGGQESKMYINWLVLTAWNVVLGPLGWLFLSWRTYKAGRAQGPAGSPYGSHSQVGQVALPSLAA